MGDRLAGGGVASPRGLGRGSLAAVRSDATTACGPPPNWLARRHAAPRSTAGRCSPPTLALPWPTEPLAKLWHAATLLREQRGDGHVAVLAAAGLSGRESNVLHAAAGRVPREMIMRSRDYDDDQWRHYQDRLAERGLLDR